MEKQFTINMTKDDMLRFYANKIVEEGIKDCTEFSNIVDLTDYGDTINLVQYKDEIIRLLYLDERIADVTIDEDLNIDMVFYTDYCPFYYDEQEKRTYNKIMDSPTYQGIILAEFSDYVHNQILEESFISTRNLINNFTSLKNLSKENESALSNFLKKSIVQTGFADKYIDNINVYVTYKNYEELEIGLFKIVNQKDEEAKKTMEENETEFE